ncbi:GNAT family N-acetyltransferase [Polyangium sorediatum]|uniref:GNAT family N-acetyltransferase n=1 Tax=Polyangium sorediatum TaxID=889274 RepID=A0ABT6NYD9_9BACT|nr:GNAT family N-acetyltransferase [Polyangium sorediatum]MDI1433157.1 GNAT family N-acetyltransferase [Polyangium sorediatum]
MTKPLIRAVTREEVREHVASFALLHGVRPEEFDADFMDWWFFQNPTHEGLLAGAFDGDRLVGYVGFAAQHFLVQGRRVSAAILSSAFTHPDYRGKGLFQRLIRFLVEAAGTRGHEAVFGWPNETALRIYLGRLGFSAMFPVDRSARPVSWGPLGARFGPQGVFAAECAGAAFDRMLPLRLGRYRYEIGPPGEHEWQGFMARVLAASDCMLERPHAYVRWRLARPRRDYIEVLLRDEAGVLRAWASARLPIPGEPPRLHIGDSLVDPRSRGALRALFAACVMEARHCGLEQVYTIARSARLGSSLAALGFLSRRSTTPIVAIATSNADLSLYQGWEYRDADMDMF